MAETLVERTEKWVKKLGWAVEHHLRTAYWVKKLDPKAGEALLLAALTHDIERAFEEGRTPPVPDEFKISWDDPIYNRWHQDRSAKFVGDFLKGGNADSELIKEVSDLVKHHEEGGSEETGLLRDADSLSYLEVVVPFFISLIPTKLSKEQVKEKVDFMFERIGGNKAMKLAKPFYDKAVSELDRNLILKS